MKKIVFIVPPNVELLDLAGPVQVFTEAKFYGLKVDLEFYHYRENPVCTSGLVFGEMANFKNAKVREGDFVFVPGMAFNYVKSKSFKDERNFFSWLKECADKKVVVCSICSGSFALGEAGLLDGRECTTHWRRVELLQQQFPKAKVVGDILYAKSNNVYTTAGVTAGIDLALSILEDLEGALMANKVARGLVVYQRRSGKHKQQNIYLAFRNHISSKVHEVQDLLISKLKDGISIDELSAIVGMSPRNLTRLFKEATGSTIVKYLNQLRSEAAKNLLKNSEYTFADVATQCGFRTARQLQRILKN